MKFIEKQVKAVIESDGSRKAARIIINKYIYNKYGLSLYELPDSVELMNNIEELSDLLTEMNDSDSFNSEEIMFFLNDMFSDDELQNLIFS